MLVTSKSIRLEMLTAYQDEQTSSYTTTVFFVEYVRRHRRCYRRIIHTYTRIHLAHRSLLLIDSSISSLLTAQAHEIAEIV